MIESPLIQELLTENTEQTMHKDIHTILETRFGKVPADLAERIRSVPRQEQLESLVRAAVACEDVEAFRKALPRQRKSRGA